MNARIESRGITTELLLEVFDIPVSFHRCLVPVAGGVTPALMLSQAIWTSQALEPSAGGWFMRSQEQWTQETGLSRWGQARPGAGAHSCSGPRRTLAGEPSKTCLLEERRLGMPAKLWFRVCADVLMHALQASVDRGGR